ncbi:allantoicase-like [Temnothorax longispinosus]|uniref:allantoicase-like n=1 Tax=Temnothorax longispinosus TaxID=300112 RepID=UPI003A98DDA1
MDEREVYELSSRENGARIVFATDDYFGVAENLLKEEEPVQQDGWVTRSRHEEGHDFAIIELPDETKIDFICIDTAFFTNNFPIQFSIQGARRTAMPLCIQNRKNRLGQSATTHEMESIEHFQSEIWQYLITKTNLEPGYPSISKKFFVRYNINHRGVTHVRLNIFPSGGIARLRIYGKIVQHVYQQSRFAEFDLISRIHDGRCVSYSSKHSGHPNNLLKPGSPINADDGWETVKTMPNMPLMAQKSIVEMARNNVEWADFKLGHIGKISFVVIDTSHFKGNAPSSVHVKGKPYSSSTWLTIIPETKAKFN